MRKKYESDKFKIKGESSLLFIIAITIFTTLILLPLMIYIIQHQMVLILFEEIKTCIELSSYESINFMDKEALSEGRLILVNGYTDAMNKRLDVIDNPLLNAINVDDTTLNKNQLTIHFTIHFRPSLILLHNSSAIKTYSLTVELPLDRGKNN